jgi:hypothetical protein
MNERKRRSRWSTAPKLHADGSIKITRPTDRDRNYVFPILERYKTLPGNFIHALMGPYGGHQGELLDHYTDLSPEPNCYLVHHKTQERHVRANSRFICYTLPETRLKNFWHDLLCCLVMAQIEIGSKIQDLRYIHFDSILAKAPEATRKRKDPHTLQLTTNKGKTVKIIPDWPVFALGRDRVRFFVLEVDCHSEPLTSRKRTRSSIERKFEEYLALNEQNIPATTWGLQTKDGKPVPIHVLFITDLPSRVESMRNLLLRMTDGRGSPHFGFAYYPSYDDLVKPPKPTGEFIKTPILRAGCEPLYLDK